MGGGESGGKGEEQGRGKGEGNVGSRIKSFYRGVELCCAGGEGACSAIVK